EIQAWKHGPVVPSIRPTDGGGEPIATPLDYKPDRAQLTSQQQESIQHVWANYRQFSAWGLRERSHAEDPWRNSYHPDVAGKCQETITLQGLREWFGARYHEAGGIVGDASDSAGPTLSHAELARELSWLQ
ncbi:MAG: Panacea domain-containing protein, partial [Gemmataceae bacterium]